MGSKGFKKQGGRFKLNVLKNFALKANNNNNNFTKEVVEFLSLGMI